MSAVGDPPHDLDRLIREVLATLGYDADAAAIAKGVRRLDYGLPAEDEFSVICSWLEQCRLLHKLDQLQVPPPSKDAFQVPDLLVAFASGSPCLIEVKVFNDQPLSFKPAYHARLLAYADLLKLPLLIAWKFHSVWILFDARHLKLAKVNFNISLSEAMRQNLMGVLVGDIAYKLADGAGVHFVMAKEALLDTVVTEAEFTETWQMRCRDVYFTDGDGKRRGDLHSETAQLFATWDLQEVQKNDDTEVKMSFVAQGGMEFAHRALVQLLGWQGGSTGPHRWRSLLRSPEITRSITSFRKALTRALGEGVVSHIIHVVPADQPNFITVPERRDQSI